MGIFDKFFGKKEELCEGAETIPPQVGNTGCELEVQDVFFIAGRGTVAVGVVNSGTFKVGDRVVIVGNGTEIITKIMQIVKLNKTVKTATAGEDVGFLLKDVSAADVKRSDLIKK